MQSTPSSLPRSRTPVAGLTHHRHTPPPPRAKLWTADSRAPTPYTPDTPRPTPLPSPNAPPSLAPSRHHRAKYAAPSDSPRPRRAHQPPPPPFLLCATAGSTVRSACRSLRASSACLGFFCPPPAHPTPPPTPAPGTGLPPSSHRPPTRLTPHPAATHARFRLSRLATPSDGPHPRLAHQPPPPFFLTLRHCR